MKFVVFGLTLSSSWGNGHATLWRGLCRALAERGHFVVFFERDTPYYRQHRDLWQLTRGELVLYDDWEDARLRARRELADSDVAMVTSYCPDGPSACRLVLAEARGQRVFYDLDTPVTLAAIEQGERPSYLGPNDLHDFDLVLSFTSGRALELLKEKLGAKRAAPLYGHVDPQQHQRAPASSDYSSALSYLGTYSADRQSTVEELFLAPARARQDLRFVLGGAMYPDTVAWPTNVARFDHVSPGAHSSFFCSSALTLNVTRDTMRRLGYCPSGRLFEAAACGVPIVSDWFEGLDSFFDPSSELFVARDQYDVLAALAAPRSELVNRAQRARERVLECHTSARRALELEQLLWSAAAPTKNAPVTAFQGA